MIELEYPTLQTQQPQHTNSNTITTRDLHTDFDLGNVSENSIDEYVVYMF